MESKVLFLRILYRNYYFGSLDFHKKVCRVCHSKFQDEELVLKTVGHPERCVFHYSKQNSRLLNYWSEDTIIPLLRKFKFFWFEILGNKFILNKIGLTQKIIRGWVIFFTFLFDCAACQLQSGNRRCVACGLPARHDFLNVENGERLCLDLDGISIKRLFLSLIL